MRCTLVGLLLCSLTAVAADSKPTGDKIVSPDAKWELLFTRTAPITGGLTEGPAVAPDGSIYFSDIPMGSHAGMIQRFDPHTKRTSVFAFDSGKSNGLIFDSQGRLVSCEGADVGGRRITRWNVATGEREVVADRYQGKKFNAPNDVCLDRQGRIYFTDPRYVGTETRELEHRAVYRIDKDGSVTEITHNVSKPNGIAISPDGKTLFLADHDNGTDRIDPSQPEPKKGAMKIYSFPLKGDGTLGERRTIHDFGDQAGCDGMTVDDQGHIYLTARGAKRPGVLVLNADGQEVAHIPTPGLPSNVEFGIGDESNVLYTTIDLSLYRIVLKTKAFHVQYAK